MDAIKPFSEIKHQYPSLETCLSSIPETTIDRLKLLFSCIDLTSLDVTDHAEKIKGMCQKVNQFSVDYPEIPSVASICVYPSLVETVKATLKVRKTGITSVAGGFPSSQTELEVKELETEIAVFDGATEIDIVLSVGKFLNGQFKEAGREISEIKKLCKKAHLKVILETGCLPDEETIYQASMLALQSGADFIKTSTGKVNPAATPEAMYVMCIALSEFNKMTGQKRGIKPAGGITTTEGAMQYLSILSHILGEEWMNPKLFRIGASRLANSLLESILIAEGKEYKAYF